MAPRRASSADGGSAVVRDRRSDDRDPAVAGQPGRTSARNDGAASPRDPKRRKIRKGTHSCWACKRKKIRCTFTSPDGEPIDPDADNADTIVCDGCRRRGTPCVSQELPEATALSAAATSSRQVDDRLGRMEALVEMLVKNATRGGPAAGTASPLLVASSPASERSRTTASSSNSNDCRRIENARADTRITSIDADANGTASDSEDEEEGGPDNLLSQPDQTPDSIALHTPEALTSIREGYVSIGRTGIVTPSESDERDTPTYTTWFGHQRGIEEEEQPGNISKLIEPATPASTVATSATRGGSGSRAQAGASSSGDAGGATATEVVHPPSQFHAEYMRRYNSLAAAWPSPEDLTIIKEALSVPVRSGLYKVLVFAPFSAVLAAETPPVDRETANTVLVLPPVGAHLVLVAQKLLILASFLQHLHPLFDPAVKRLSVSHRELMQRAVCAANMVVTGNDHLIGSLEGIQCLVMLGVFQSNQGNLRRAWLSFRRAMTMCQLMGLQRLFPAATVKTLDPSSEQATMPQCLWFRIVYADRYLSLMLGLPQGSPGDGAVSCSAGRQAPKPALPAHWDEETVAFYEARSATQKIAEAHAIIVGRIIERNEAWRGEDCEEDEGKCREGSAEDVLSTQSIDLALQRASRSMPAQWWLVPTICDGDGDGAAMFMHMQRLTDQLFHYHLLTQLHLPYMLRRGTAQPKTGNRSSSSSSAAGGTGTAGSVDRYAYSKITCVSASREVLSRFLSLRSCKQITFFCRSIDFFALLASMTLCLAHLDSHRNEHQQNRLEVNDFLAHQRLSDRGMMERVLESMEEMAHLNEDDALSAKSAAFLRRMLDVEEDASLEVAASLGCPVAQSSLHLKASAPADDLRVWVPFLGTIRINKEGILRVKGNDCPLVLSPSQEPRQCKSPQEYGQGQEGQEGGEGEEGQAPSQDQAQLQQHQQPQQQPAQSAMPQPLHLDTLVPTATTPAFNNDLIVTYPNFAAGETFVVNPLTGLTVVPSWSSASSLVPSSSLPFPPPHNPEEANPYMLYPQAGLPSAAGGGSLGGGGSSGARGSGAGGGGGSAGDWTLQGVDFAFFENLLMHGGLGDLASGATAAQAAAAVAGAGGADGSGDNSGPGTAASVRGPEINMDTVPEVMRTSMETTGTSAEDIPLGGRRAGRFGENWLW